MHISILIFLFIFKIYGGSDGKNPLVMRETRVQSLRQEDSLEKGMTAHSSVLAWRILWAEEPGGLQSMGSQRVRHDWSDLVGTQAWTFCSVQSLGRVCFIAAPWTPACQASLSFTITRSLLKFMSIESLMLSNRLILCQPLLLLSSIFPSIRVFSHQVAKVL